jgi:hypothetical protein
LANSNEEGKTYIGPSLEPCAPPVRTPMMDARVCAYATHVAGAAATTRGRAYAPLGRVRPRLAARAPLSVPAPWPCVPLCPCPPFGRAHPLLRVRPRSRACPACSPRCHARPSLPCAPHVRAFLTRPCPYCVRLPSPEYKSYKLVVHFTTWASGPLTTERWLTAGCLGGDHSFYIHSHSHALSVVYRDFVTVT